MSAVITRVERWSASGLHVIRPELLRFLGLHGAMSDEAEDILHGIGLKLTVQPPGLIDRPRAYLYRNRPIATAAYVP